MIEGVDVRARFFLPMEMLRDRGADKLFCDANRFLQIQSASKPGSDRGRIGAAGTVCRDTANERRRKLDDFVAGEKEICRPITREMTAL